MGFLQDNLIPFFKKREIRFIEHVKDSDDMHTFLFEKDTDLHWHAGQYGLFTITHQKIKNATKPFSVASAPAENVVRISTVFRDQPSEFKKALLALKPGETVLMRGPVGPFYLKEDRPALFMAAGIGITPFRSIIKQLELTGEGKSRQPIHLLYLSSGKPHYFQDELNEAASKANIKIEYLTNKNDLYEKIDKFTNTHKNDGSYYFAGSKEMVRSIADHLQSQQISKKNMIKDEFFGY